MNKPTIELQERKKEVIKEIIDDLEYVSCNPQDSDIPKIANMIYARCLNQCPVCGAKLEIWSELFGEEHHC